MFAILFSDWIPSTCLRWTGDLKIVACPCRQTLLDQLSGTFLFASSSNFTRHLVSDGSNLILTRICWFFLLWSAVNFFCFVYTVSLKLSAVNFAIFFCLPALSTWPIGPVFLRFLITVFWLIPVSFSMVTPIFCISSSSPGSSNPLIARHGRREIAVGCWFSFEDC